MEQKYFGRHFKYTFYFIFYSLAFMLDTAVTGITVILLLGLQGIL